jgi:hypothetical protein
MRRLGLIAVVVLGVAIVAVASLGRSAQSLSRVAHVAGTGSINSDLAFWGDLAFAGNFDGFRVVDISSSTAPKVLAAVRCPGEEADVSVWDGLVFLSVDKPVTRPSCEGEPTTADAAGAWEGIRIFDVTNPRRPRFVSAVRTDCGSHTHTLVPDLDNDRVLLYVSSAGSQLGRTASSTTTRSRSSRCRVLRRGMCIC